MSKPQDLAVIITVHAEGRLMTPTFRALARALATASADGVHAEVVIVEDCADQATEETVSALLERGVLHKADRVRVLPVRHGDLGLARNAGIAATDAAFIGVLDADNLPSRNWLTSAWQLLRSRHGPAIIHPETIITFDGRRECWPLMASGSEDFHPGALNWVNPWDAFCLASREVFERFPYPECRPQQGFGPEDWAWNCTTVAADVPHLVAEGTTLFYWARGGSLASAHGDSLLPRNALMTSTDVATSEIERLDALLAPADPAQNVPLTPARQALQRARERSRLVDLSWRSARYLARPVRDRLRRRGTSQPAGPDPLPDAVAAVPRDQWAEAHELQPLVPYPSMENLRSYHVWGTDWDAFMLPDRRAYWRAIATLPQRIDLLYIVPWIGTGGADRLAVHYITAARRLRPDASIAVITTEPTPSTRLDALPDDVVVHELGRDLLLPQFATKVIGMLLAQLRPGTLHVINSTVGYDAVDRFGRQIAAHTRIFLSTYVIDRLANGATWSFLYNRSRDFYTHVTRVLTDNLSFVHRMVEETGAPRDAFNVHHQAVAGAPHQPLPDRFDASRPLRMLWCGRLDHQKRLDRLAALLETLRARSLPVTLDVYGEPVIGDADDLEQTCARLTRLGAVLHPAYRGDLRAVSPDRFDLLLMTSDWEGVPNTMLEGMANGLVIVATAVGGVIEVLDESTGYPVPIVQVENVVNERATVDALAEALAQVIADPADARRRIRTAAEFVADQFSPQAFEAALKELPGYLPAHLPAHIEADEHPLTFFTDRATRALLRSGRPITLLYTGSNGHSNFGDILQNKNVLGYWDSRDDAQPVLLLPAFSGRAGRAARLRAWYTPNIVFFAERSAAPAALRALADDSTVQLDESDLARADTPLLHVVGGGYLNRMWGDSHLSIIEEASRAWRTTRVVMSGLQIDRHGAAGLRRLIDDGLPATMIGFRDRASLDVAREHGLGSLARYTFDDLTEMLQDWSGARVPRALPAAHGVRYAVHMNSSGYAGGPAALSRWGDVLDHIAAQQPDEVILLHAYEDARVEVQDTLDTAAALGERFPFITFRVISIAKAALRSTPGDGLPEELTALRGLTAGFSASYHTALMLTFLGVPAYLVNASDYFAQKAKLFQLPSIDEFLNRPETALPDLTAEIDARTTWIEDLSGLRLDR
ncbi:glycosyltransferase [Pseudoclavibacter caeni]|jgi:glycosyltransferase involved in cell wall biosynthesis|nr:glycosyltransferase [Pseudoclavibacter caeni]NYJ96340.1 glycosyltransferase involved in cell wall biosynthesis [Pseudoclavibacter caeni]